MADQETLTALARIEQRQAAIERSQASFTEVAHRILDMMEIHNEKLDEVLKAATVEPGPSPVAEALAALLTATQEQTRLLTGLPQALAVTIREEMQRELEAEGYEMEPAMPGSFDGDDGDQDSGPH